MVQFRLDTRGLESTNYFQICTPLPFFLSTWLWPIATQFPHTAFLGYKQESFFLLVPSKHAMLNLLSLSLAISQVDSTASGHFQILTVWVSSFPFLKITTLNSSSLRLPPSPASTWSREGKVYQYLHFSPESSIPSPLFSLCLWFLQDGVAGGRRGDRQKGFCLVKCCTAQGSRRLPACLRFPSLQGRLLGDVLSEGLQTQPCSMSATHCLMTSPPSPDISDGTLPPFPACVTLHV